MPNPLHGLSQATHVLSAANVRDCGKEAEMNKQANQKSNQKLNQKVTILYERLSVEDDRDAESQSIENQREILQDHAEKYGLLPYVHVADDGYSGTTWERPGWNGIIARIEAGEVANILVKDSSRIGRDFLRVGLFREFFREKSVRLICVTDGYDSKNGEDDFAPFRDIMSEWYALCCRGYFKWDTTTTYAVGLFAVHSRDCAEGGDARTA